ncbi:hypothetical protein AWJ20_671 [Sugiyamaella lignohabitans]|uniref:Enoyl reductase (ER) domain-containing protein n=1 Tax=Sugiyamaella lignohabitans TaxID=796027 RepID=A0A161HKS0_9ASCO|nr:uncharacterized protein AWJ20_671 [Sugiyamaella lignohabitans]ANB12418.1 hypothetical protein AWJ20_671 [Sugiyamaella lignohabitans]
MPSIPTFHKAYVVQGTKGVFKTIPVPKIGAGEILIKVEAVAINPTDWKHIGFDIGEEAVVGCDVAGTVVDVADDVRDFKAGDQVFGLVSGANRFSPDNGAFAEYARLIANRTLKASVKFTHSGSDLPVGPVINWEGAASLPVGLYTALMAFNYYGKISIEDHPEFHDEYFLVWGGSSSLGQAVIQIARKVGFKVIATASKHNFETLDKLFVEKCFDYHDDDVLDQIKKYTGGKLAYAYDTITAPPTTINVYSVLPKDRESTLFISLPFDASTVKEPNPKVSIKFPLAYLAIDKKKDIEGIQHSPDGLFESTIQAIKTVNDNWAKNPQYLQHMPVKILKGGIDAIPEGLELVKAGKNSGVKIVVPIVE